MLTQDIENLYNKPQQSDLIQNWSVSTTLQFSDRGDYLDSMYSFLARNEYETSTNRRRLVESL
jgi:hypothetical protein